MQTPADPTHSADNRYRLESDSLGTVRIPATALYGSNTFRGLQNFPFTDRALHQEPGFLRAIVAIKKAAAHANHELGVLQAEKANAIAAACEEILNGQHSSHFVIPLLEGSGGTSTNMNVNEVICNRALQLLHKRTADYDTLHPNDHVNLGQSTNDVIPSAIKIACHDMSAPSELGLPALAEALQRKADEFEAVYRLGRTCLQDAQPMTLGQAFAGYASAIGRATESLLVCRQQLLTLPLGGTAIGTGLGAAPGFKARLFNQLQRDTKLSLQPAGNAFDGMQNLDALQHLSAQLETTTSLMAKIAKDLILLSSGPAGGLAEISLPARQPGSSIMPGKVNPVLPMAMVQLAQLVHGNHAGIAMACQDGMLEINHYEMTVASRLFDSLHRIREITTVFAHSCIDGIIADEQRCMDNLMRSFAMATALVPTLGYQQVSELVKQSVRENTPFLQLAVAANLLKSEQITELMHTSVTHGAPR